MFGQIRAVLADRFPVDDWDQVDTSVLPVKDPCRRRGLTSWVGPNGLAAINGRGLVPT